MFQSAVSRQIATLEQSTSMRLFERSSAGVTLTRAGRHLHEAIATGLGLIRRGITEAAGLLGDEEVVIACPHGSSQFIVQPRYSDLCEFLGERVRVRVTTYDEDIGYLPPNPAADVVFTWNEAHKSTHQWVRVLKEAVMPVCSPKYAETHAELLNGPTTGWGAATLIDYTWPNDGWVTWDDWFDAHGRPEREPRYIGFDSYPYVLEAAAAGRGIAMGWRCFLENHLASGALTLIGNGFVEFNRNFICVLTEKGRGNSLSLECLCFFEDIQPLSPPEAEPAAAARNPPSLGS